MAAERIRVVLDVDTGVDDACALLLACRHPSVDLAAVTCVAGNAPLADAVRNTLTVLEVAGRTDVPVAAGAPHPLLGAARDARHVHGVDGMGDLGWPPSTRAPAGAHAVELIRDLLREAALGPPEGRLTLVSLGPLTNVALLLRTYPEAVAGLDRIVMMGGALYVDDTTASAEFNVWQDPEAAAIVLAAATEADLPLVMYGLDVFYDVRVSRTQAARMRGAGDAGTPAALAADLVTYQCVRFGTDSATLGDAGALCAAIDPAGLTTSRTPVRVHLSGTWTRGRTVVDRRVWRGNVAGDPDGTPTSWAEVAVAVDGARYARLWRETVSAPPGPRSGAGASRPVP